MCTYRFPINTYNTHVSNILSVRFKPIKNITWAGNGFRLVMSVVTCSLPEEEPLQAPETASPSTRYVFFAINKLYFSGVVKSVCNDNESLEYVP